MSKHRLRAGAAALAGFAIFGGHGIAAAQQLTQAQTSFFESKIRPIFVDRCYKCHSATEGKVKGGLSMDTKEGLLHGGNTGPALVAGKVEESLIIEAVRYKNVELQMPPKGEKLSALQIADLETWIKMGAPDPRGGTAIAKGEWKAAGSDHWAFQPVAKSGPPAVQQREWVANPVDAFILAKLEGKGLKPSPAAARPTLIRRAYFDLIGLPPTPEEIRVFVEDKSPNAFEKVVDHLLQSQHYGERWGRYWLDVARYSDTKGDTKRNDVPVFPYAWTYRDYVIKAVNEDKPYDQFILEQLAADQLPADKTSKGALAALGFLTLGDQFGGSENDILNDRIDTTTKAFLALTVACARCHDHKFDPIPTADYYSLRGVFLSSTVPREKPLLAEPKDTKDYRDYQQQRAVLEKEYVDYVGKELEKARGDFLGNAWAYLLASVQGGNDLIDKMDKKPKLVRETRQQWGRVLNTSKKVRDPIFGPWFEFRGLKPADYAKRARDLALKIAQNNDKNRPLNAQVAGAFRGATPKSMTDVAMIYGRLFAVVNQAWEMEQDAYEKRAKAGRAGTPPSRLRDAQMESLRNVMFTYAGGNRNDDSDELIFRMLPRNAQGRVTGIRTKLARLEIDHPGAPARAMAIADKSTPEESPIFVRGEPGNKGKVVPRQFLEVLSGSNRKPFQNGSGRLELARAIASKDNPITARVMVNRIWLHHFGEGIVNTPDDFGHMAEKPSHPGLLDWLARSFMDNGWSQKKLHKLIMLSNTYQQSSGDNPRNAQVDPDNRLLWRANIRRLDFEPLRDAILSIGGTLDLEPGGKPVDLGKDSHRRSVYGYIDRANVLEVMNIFDFATPEMETGKRYQTTVPQQALFLMNSPLVVEQARNAVNRPEFRKLSTDEDKVTYLYNLIYQRPPSDVEMKLAREFIVATPLQDTIPIALQTAPQPAAQKGKGKTKGRQPSPAAKQDSLARPLEAWGKLAHALFESNEFSFVN